MDLSEFMAPINFTLLKKQKEELLKVLENTNNENLDGLIHLIDHIQDTAVDVLGYPEDAVFNLTES